MGSMQGRIRDWLPSWRLPLRALAVALLVIGVRLVLDYADSSAFRELASRHPHHG